MCRSGTYDVVRAQWLLHCLDAGQLLSWTPGDVISASPVTAERLAHSFDCYGDSYTEFATEHSLKHTLSQVVQHSHNVKNIID